METNLRDFKEYELFPAMYADLTRAFPELHFEKYAKGWRSTYHIDDLARDSKGAYTTVANAQGWVKDWARGSKGFIDLYMDINRVDFSTALKQLSNLYGLTPPGYDENEERDYRETQRQREEDNKTFQAALWGGSPEAEEVLAYMRGRGWRDEDIKAVELGLITTAIINSLPEASRVAYNSAEVKEVEENGKKVKTTLGRVGETHNLAIPYRIGGSLLGFTFRRIFEREENSQKYLNSKGMRKRALLNIGFGATDVVLVEGYLDALHAKAVGMSNVVAATEAAASDDMISDAIRRGVKRFTLLLDNDKAGGEAIPKTIEKIHRLGGGLTIFVANLPGVKDLDEYLVSHTAEEAEAEIRKAVPYSLFLLSRLVRKYTEKAEAGEITFKEREDFFRDIEKLTNSPYIKPYEREDIYRELQKYEGSLPFAFDVQGLREWIDSAYYRKQEAQKAKAAKEASAKIQAAVERGDTAEALRLMEQTAKELQRMDGESKFADLLHIPTREERIQRLREKPEALVTSYQFTEGGEVPLPLTIPSGAITILAAPTGMGKSLFLRNLAIDISKRYEDKNVLYFTFEESEEDVWMQFTNTYIGKRLHAPSKKHQQIDTITEYCKTGDTSYIGGVNAEINDTAFKNKEREFSNAYLDSGRIRIYFRDYDLDTLISALEFAVANTPTLAVFVDYIQILKAYERSKQTRAEQLKEICIALKDFSVKHRLPVVIAAQLTREAKTPIRMDNQMISESSDIEKAANTIICLWNSNKEASAYGANAQGVAEQKEITELKAKGFEMGKPGKIIAKITKRRGRGVGMYAIFEHKGESGKIVENYDPDKDEEEPPTPEQLSQYRIRI